jgi:hypothetical protein
VSNNGVCVEAPGHLIRGVHKYCDDWCERCPVTNRCLSFRMRQERRATYGPDRNLTMSDMVAFTREVAKAAGETTEGLDAMLTGDPKREFQPRPADEWLADVGLRYGTSAARFLRNVGWDRPMPDGPSDNPSPLEMLAWYHLLVAARSGRALIALARAERGVPGELQDAQGCAKIAHVSIDRSLDALRVLGKGRHRVAVQPLESMLRTLSVGLETRIPGGRTFVRAGLDAPVG